MRRKYAKGIEGTSSLRKDTKTLTAAASLSIAFGSIHSFGAFLETLEGAFAVQRATVSFGYSLAIVCLTLGVLSYRKISFYCDPRQLAVACCGITAIALLGVAAFTNFEAFLIAYGLVFGFCNGLVYALFLDIAAASFPRRAGLATGLLTAAYGAGAAAFSLILGLVAGQSAVLGFVSVAVAILLAGFVSFHWFPKTLTDAQLMKAVNDKSRSSRRAAAVFWAIYALAATGGLMIVGHAAAIMTARGADQGFAYIAVLLNALGNIVGSVTAGWLSERIRPITAIILAIVIQIASLLALIFSDHEMTNLLLLTSCGYAYGSLIAAIPLALRALLMQRYFGVVFTAWGTAGLIGPVLAGALFDSTGSYTLAINTATIFSAFALITAFRAAFLHPENGNK